MSKRLIVGSFLLIVVIGAIFGFRQYKFYLMPNVPLTLEETLLEIPTGLSFDEVLTLFNEKGVLKDTTGFRAVAERMNYLKNPMRAGRFRVETGWSNVSLIRHLRNGKQETTPLVINSARLVDEIAGIAAEYLEEDSLAFVQAIRDETLLQELGYTDETLMALFIPNTYDFFWNTSPKEFLFRMQKEHDTFWSRDDRMAKAEALGLSPVEVYTLASIVEKETNQNSEKKRMAGVYLNRLDKGMLLQADPTAVFATRDFTTHRVTNYHTKFDSPYNTYMYTGLPPGPIAMASIASIDAVLNAEEHDYIFFCAIGDNSGLHAFAETLSGHNQNVRRYRENLRRRLE